MLKRPSYEEARDLLLSLVRPRETERVPLEESAGRVLAQELYAAAGMDGLLEETLRYNERLKALGISALPPERPAVL